LLDVVVAGDDALKFFRGFLRECDVIELYFQKIGASYVCEHNLLCEGLLILERGYGYGVKLIKSLSSIYFPGNVYPCP
jgi:hypothetical protein